MSADGAPRALPASGSAWAITAAGVGLTLLAIWVELPMWAVEFGLALPAAGGGEYLLMLFVGLPSSLVSVALLAVAEAKPAWRSRFGRIGLYVALAPLIGVAVVIARN